MNDTIAIEIEMTCCGSVYNTVSETVDHVCPTPEEVKVFKKFVKTTVQLQHAKDRVENIDCGISKDSRTDAVKIVDVWKSNYSTEFDKLFEIGAAGKFAAWKRGNAK